MLDILFLSRSSLLYAVLLLSAITILPKSRGGPAAFARFQKKQRRRQKPAALSVSVETTSYLIFRAST